MPPGIPLLQAMGADAVGSSAAARAGIEGPTNRSAAETMKAARSIRMILPRFTTIGLARWFRASVQSHGSERWFTAQSSAALVENVRSGCSCSVGFLQKRGETKEK